MSKLAVRKVSSLLSVVGPSRLNNAKLKVK